MLKENKKGIGEKSAELLSYDAREYEKACHAHVPILMVYAILATLLTITLCQAQIIKAPEVLDDLNEERTRRGLKPLTYNSQPQSSCDAWAERITKNLIHNYSEKRKGEVISQIYGNPELIIPMFMRSKSHKKILMDRRAKEVCFSVYRVPPDTIVTKNAVEYIPTAFFTVIRTY